jgi:TRAP-type C4-dicarboxylate transport system permease small subunit
LQFFAWLITKVNQFLFDVAKWAVILISLLMLYEVISRYSFHSPTSWAPELATLLFGPFFLLGGPYLLHLRGHVSVDVLSSKAKGKLAIILSVTAVLLATVFGLILFWFSLPLAIQSFQYSETSFTSWNPQIWPSKLILPFSAAMLVLQSVAELVFCFSSAETQK